MIMMKNWGGFYVTIPKNEEKIHIKYLMIDELHKQFLQVLGTAVYETVAEILCY